jgi:hypothetical protein
MQIFDLLARLKCLLLALVSSFLPNNAGIPLIAPFHAESYLCPA